MAEFTVEKLRPWLVRRPTAWLRCEECSSAIRVGGLVLQLDEIRLKMKGRKRISCMRLEKPKYNGCSLKYDEAWDRLLSASDNEPAPGVVIIRPKP